MEHKALKAGLHYDLRFKLPKSQMWISFASRKKIPLEMGTKRLIVQTNNHSEKEALFTGTIERGYGAGKITKWDSGDCNIIKFTSKHIVLEFKGSKIKGTYHLISTGVIDKDYNKPTYLLFKGRSVIKEQIEELKKTTTNEMIFEIEKRFNKQLIKENTKDNETYAIICQFTALKGFFKKKPAGEFLILGIKDQYSFMLLQFFQHIKNDLYLVGLVGTKQSSYKEDLEAGIDQLRYSAFVKVLEDRIPVMVYGLEIRFIKASKYLGKYIKIIKDSKLPEGYFIAQCKIKPGFKPALVYMETSKSGPQVLDQTKKIRAFVASRFR